MNENLIDRYLLNLLTSEERESFEKELKSNETLRNDFLLHKQTFEDIEGIGRIELKAKLQKIHESLEFENPSKKSNIRNLIIKFAAAAVFIGVVFGSLFWMQNSPTNSEIYAQNFEPYAISLTQRSDSNSAYQEIENLYSTGNYSKAIPLFEYALNQGEVKSSNLLLGLGISYLKTNQPKKAVIEFNKIITNKDFNFEDEATWYLAMSYLKMNDKSNASKYLKELASSPEKDHHSAAKLILNQIK